MKIGFSSIYSFRPHVEHLWYLAQLVRQAGHEAHFLTCDGGLDLCYARALKGTSQWEECPKCVIGGIRSYPARPIRRIASGVDRPVTADVLDCVQSSISTILRTETSSDLQTGAAEELRQPLARAAAKVAASTRDWIAAERLDGVVMFNGRMDLTRAMILACREAMIPFVTVERTWFGDGLQLVPNGDCLSLVELERLNAYYDNLPLTEEQARYAGALVASRFLRKNSNEWRAYNLGATRSSWPVQTREQRVLILPSSWNECQGHPDWQIGWREATDGFDWLLDQLAIEPHQVVVRCHPNWSEKIGRSTGTLSQQHYSDWTKRRGYHCIRSDQTASTYDLIPEADLVLVNGSTAAFEAGACGKPVICVGSALYKGSSLAILVANANQASRLQELGSHTPEKSMRKALRFGYTMSRRFAQYFEHVKSSTPTRYGYRPGADGGRIVRMLASGRIEPDDPVEANDDTGESSIVKMIAERRWEDLFNQSAVPDRSQLQRIRRRPALAWLDALRDRMPTGDR